MKFFKKIIAFIFSFDRELTSSGGDIVTMINWQHRALRVDNRALIYIELHFFASNVTIDHDLHCC